MQCITVHKKNSLKGAVSLPGDKSISHRAVILGSIVQGQTQLRNFCSGEDTARTIDAFRSLGVKIEGGGSEYIVWGKGLNGLQEPQNVIDAGNSGTTTRLLTGLLSGQDFFSIITGDDSLRKRPMKRITDPLRSMGAKIDGRENGDFAPLAIRGGKLNPIRYTTPVASAQIKSALLLAGLYADGITEVTEPSLSRDHTERMLEATGARIIRDGTTVRLKGFPALDAFSLSVPGDLSSAAFFIVGATLLPGSKVLIRNVGVNPLRTGVLSILEKMGAHIETVEAKEGTGEPYADLLVKYAPLQAVEIKGEMIPRSIDEIPILAVAAARAEGTTVIRDAKELRVKESDRIKGIVSGLRKFGVAVEEFDDGMAITGSEELKGATVSSYGDHRLAMAFIIAGITASGETRVEDTASIATSFPEFTELLESLSE